MSQVEDNEFELDDVVDDTEAVPAISSKDTKSKQKYEARKRIDELLEEKRLRKLLGDDWEQDDEDENG